MTIQAYSFSEDAVEDFAHCEDAKAAPGKTWVHVSGTDQTEWEETATLFDIHQLALEDVRNDVRPKFEEYEAYTFILIKTAVLARGETSFAEELKTEPVGIFIGPDWLVTLTPSSIAPVDTVFSNLQRGETRILSRTIDFTAYRIIDRIVDDYFNVLEEVEVTLERIEDAVVEETGIETLEMLNAARRDLLSFRKLVWPTRDAIAPCARGDPDQINEATEKYYRDVYDHLVQLVDLTETYRDLVIGSRDIYLNSVSLSMNRVMKTLTVIATILLPLTFIVGVYGMNFSGSPYNMPELSWQFGYPAVIGGMVASAGIMLWHFRRSGWL